MKYNANIVSLFGLYFAQGTPLGFALFSLPGILCAQGADLRFIGLVGLSMLPWALSLSGPRGWKTSVRGVSVRCLRGCPGSSG